MRGTEFDGRLVQGSVGTEPRLALGAADLLESRPEVVFEELLQLLKQYVLLLLLFVVPVIIQSYRQIKGVRGS